MDLPARLRRWADTRDRRLAEGGHAGSTGTRLLREAATELERTGETVRYVNLSGGMPWLREFPDARFTRIQSTACEQKRWGTILREAGYDFLYSLASGTEVEIYDCSRRPREPRALWQGLPWIVYACQRTWGCPVDRVISRNGMDVTDQLETQYRALTDEELAGVRWVGRLLRPTVVHQPKRRWHRSEAVDNGRRLRQILTTREETHNHHGADRFRRLDTT